ncbi:hypothetical protein LTR86_002572 [Recurvomyces mirabilis]|nr:hypothetical protein LTR86_002572 [Recurvomyces mirabilis]
MLRFNESEESELQETEEKPKKGKGKKDEKDASTEEPKKYEKLKTEHDKTVIRTAKIRYMRISVRPQMPGYGRISMPLQENIIALYSQTQLPLDKVASRISLARQKERRGEVKEDSGDSSEYGEGDEEVHEEDKEEEEEEGRKMDSFGVKTINGIVRTPKAKFKALALIPTEHESAVKNVQHWTLESVFWGDTG